LIDEWSGVENRHDPMLRLRNAGHITHSGSIRHSALELVTKPE
jgi:hypothetical protein